MAHTPCLCIHLSLEKQSANWEFSEFHFTWRGSNVYCWVGGPLVVQVWGIVVGGLGLESGVVGLM